MIRTSYTAIQFKADNRREDLYIRRKHSELMAPSYCGWCGSAYVFELATSGEFDEFSGHQVIMAWLVCPRRTTYFPWSFHSRYALKHLSNDTAQKMLGDALIDKQASKVANGPE